MVRQFTAEDERRVIIALDTRMMGGVDDEDLDKRFERGVTIAASLVAHFITERAEVRLVLGSEHGRYGVGSEHLYDCLRRLALAAPDGSADVAEVEYPSAIWTQLNVTPQAGDNNYVILLTTAAPGSIPANIWRTSHVIYL